MFVVILIGSIYNSLREGHVPQIMLDSDSIGIARDRLSSFVILKYLILKKGIIGYVSQKKKRESIYRSQLSFFFFNLHILHGY